MMKINNMWTIYEVSITYTLIYFQEPLQTLICRRFWNTEEQLRAFRAFLVFSKLRKSSFTFWMSKPFTLNFQLSIFCLITNYPLDLLLFWGARELSSLAAQDGEAQSCFNCLPVGARIANEFINWVFHTEQRMSAALCMWNQAVVHTPVNVQGSHNSWL